MLVLSPLLIQASEHAEALLVASPLSFVRARAHDALEAGGQLFGKRFAVSLSWTFRRIANNECVLCVVRWRSKRKRRRASSFGIAARSLLCTFYFLFLLSLCHCRNERALLALATHSINRAPVVSANEKKRSKRKT